MELRPYQLKLLNQVQLTLQNTQNVLLQLATGGGKTCIFAQLIKDAVYDGQRVLLLVHRQELLSQAYRKLLELGVHAGVIQGDQPTDYSVPVQIASVQTLVRRAERPETDLIVVDEAHHMQFENSYGQIRAAYPTARLLGVTATPCRLDGSGFEAVFDQLIHGPVVADLMNEGYLSQYKAFSSPLDLSDLKMVAGDYVASELAERFNNQPIIGNLLENWYRYAFGRQTVVFAINVAHSQAITRQYQDSGIPAAHLDANTPEEEREEILRAFGERQLTVLSNVNIISEGFDCPGIECVQLTRPTRSLSMYLQQVGRALRPSSDKDYAVILDHANLINLHGFPDDPFEWTLAGGRQSSGQAARDDQQPANPVQENAEWSERRQIALRENRSVAMLEVYLEQVQQQERVRQGRINQLRRHLDRQPAELDEQSKLTCINWYLCHQNPLPTEWEWQQINDLIGEEPDWWRYQRAGFYFRQMRRQGLNRVNVCR